LNKTIELDTLITRSEDLAAVAFGDDIVLMSMSTGKYFSLEKTGARIWTILETPQTLAGLSANLARQYRVDPEHCLLDTRTFLEELQAWQLIKIAS
jgi:hypothetical protein